MLSWDEFLTSHCQEPLDTVTILKKSMNIEKVNFGGLLQEIQKAIAELDWKTGNLFSFLMGEIIQFKDNDFQMVKCELRRLSSLFRDNLEIWTPFIKHLITALDARNLSEVIARSEFPGDKQELKDLLSFSIAFFAVPYLLFSAFGVEAIPAFVPGSSFFLISFQDKFLSVDFMQDMVEEIDPNCYQREKSTGGYWRLKEACRISVSNEELLSLMVKLKRGDSRLYARGSLIAEELLPFALLYPEFRLIKNASNPLALLFYNLGSIYTALGDCPRAVELMEKAVCLDSNFAEAYNTLGFLLIELDRKPEAIGAFNTAIDIYPDFGAAHFNLGNLYLNDNRLDEAIGAYEQAIYSGFKSLETYNQLGAAYFKKGLLEEVIGVCEQAISFDPQYALAYNNLGLVLAGLDRRDEAKQIYEQAISRGIEFALIYYNLAVVDNELGMIAEAIAGCQQAIRLDPDYFDAQHHLGNLCLLSGKYGAAIEAYNQAIHLRPEVSLVYCNCALAYYRLGKTEEAVELWVRAVMLDSESLKLLPASLSNAERIRFYDKLGDAYLVSGKAQLALKAYEKVRELRGDVQPDSYSLNGLAIGPVILFMPQAGMILIGLIAIVLLIVYREKIKGAQSSSHNFSALCQGNAAQEHPEFDYVFNFLKETALRVAKEIEPHNPSPETFAIASSRKKGKKDWAKTTMKFRVMGALRKLSYPIKVITFIVEQIEIHESKPTEPEAILAQVISFRAGIPPCVEKYIIKFNKESSQDSVIEESIFQNNGQIVRYPIHEVREPLTRAKVDALIKTTLEAKQEHVILSNGCSEIKTIKKFFGVGSSLLESDSVRLMYYERIAKSLRTDVVIEIHLLDGLPHRGYWQVGKSGGLFKIKIFVKNGEDILSVAVHEISAAVSASFLCCNNNQIMPISHKTNLLVEEDFKRYLGIQSFYPFPDWALDEISGATGGEVDLTAVDDQGAEGCFNRQRFIQLLDDRDNFARNARLVKKAAEDPLQQEAATWALNEKAQEIKGALTRRSQKGIGNLRWDLVEGPDKNLYLWHMARLLKVSLPSAVLTNLDGYGLRDYKESPDHPNLDDESNILSQVKTEHFDALWDKSSGVLRMGLRTVGRILRELVKDHQGATEIGWELIGTSQETTAQDI